MAIEEFLNTYRDSMMNRKMVNPLTGTPNAINSTQLGIRNPKRGIAPNPGYGPKIPDWLQARQSSALSNYMNSKSERTTDMAADYSQMAAGQVPVDEYGIVQDKLTDFSNAFNQQLTGIGNTGKAALATEEAKAQWHHMQGLQELGAGYQFNWTPGASGDNPGSKAVSIAMQAVQNGTPYKWAGNSLTQGVDCSGLVQQVYAQLGIKVPRSTYEQAKYGKTVGMGSLLPGDLIFYNTGSRDPNGIGQFSHVAIYIGNGQVIEAPGKGKNVRVSSINSSGSPSRAVRPW